MYIFHDDESGIAPNNSIILTDSFGQLSQFQCISSSRSPGVGQWFTPFGHDITSTTDDPVDSSGGGMNDPGYIQVMLHSGRILTIHDQGIYACHIPDETGMNATLYVGIYLPALAGNSNSKRLLVLCSNGAYNG